MIIYYEFISGKAGVLKVPDSPIPFLFISEKGKIVVKVPRMAPGLRSWLILLF